MESADRPSLRVKLTLAGLYILATTLLYCQSLRSDIHQYNIRARHAYRVAQHRTTAFERLPSQVRLKFLNAFPGNLRSEQTFSKFKARFKRYLVASVFYLAGKFVSH
jgi:hypothetical protein